MYTIDLLQGKNVPERSSPKKVALTVLPLLLPAAVAVLVVRPYAAAGTEIPVQQKALAGFEERIDGMGDVRTLLAASEGERTQWRDLLFEVARAVKTHRQWSKVLLALAQNIPEGMTVGTLEVKRDNLSRDPKHIGVFRHTLFIGIYVPRGKTSVPPMQQVIERLRLPTVLGSDVESIEIILDQYDQIEGRAYTFYYLKCVLEQ